VKILVAVKRVADPENLNKIKLSAQGKVDTTGLEPKASPFDEYALETALRLTENGANTKARLGEVIVVTFGPKEAEQTLRATLGTGADRAIRVDATDDVLDGDLVARGPAEQIAPLPGGGFISGGHWTRDVAFSRDGKKMYVSIGSHSNVNDPDDHPDEYERADILEMKPDGGGRRVFASGLRNAVGIAIDPSSGKLWASVNERDQLGDDLPPDYITHVEPGGFYGWPWYYIGAHPDPRHKGKHPELKDKVLVPDVLLEPHDASLELTFYEGKRFPARYRGGIFAAEHGSWNRAVRTGYEIVYVPLKNGRAEGGYEDFVTGFVSPDGQVWGRPVGVAVADDGALFFSDDASGSIWRVFPSAGGR